MVAGLLTVMVKVTVSPSSGLGLSTVFTVITSYSIHYTKLYELLLLGLELMRTDLKPGVLQLLLQLQFGGTLAKQLQILTHHLQLAGILQPLPTQAGMLLLPLGLTLLGMLQALPGKSQLRA